MQLPPITLPHRVRKGELPTVVWANSIRDALNRIIRGVEDAQGKNPLSLEPPFWVRFFINSAGTGYYATVTRGVVTEFDTDGGTGVDAIIHHELTELELETDGRRPKFEPITDGKAVYVYYETDDKGKIKTDSGGKPQIKIDDDGKDSTHYDPPVGDESSGAGGVFWRKLAVLDVVDSVPKCIPWEMGGNLKHWRQLPIFKKAGGTADIFKEYDLDAGRYLTRGITAGAGITVTQNASDIEIKAAGSNLNLEVYQSTFAHDGDGHLTISQSTSPEAIYYWRNGLYVGTSDPDGGNPPAQLDTRKVSYNSIT